jgi:hypothetical protein
VRSRILAITTVLIVSALAARPGFGQDVNTPPVFGPSQGRRAGSLPTSPIPTTDDQQRQLERDSAKKANEERQAQLKRDTERLFELSNELKRYVDKTNENILSIDVIKKADEIEKLAHSIREKMKGS